MGAALLVFTTLARGAPSLDSISHALAELDGSRGKVLDQIHNDHYATASPLWRLRWHVLRCEAASLTSSISLAKRQIEVGTALATQHNHPLALGFLQACQGGLELSIDERQASLDTLEGVIALAEQLGDASLLTLALTRRGNALGDLGRFKESIESLNRALSINVTRSSSGYFHASHGLVQFSVARGFYYLENMRKVDDLMQPLLDDPKMTRALRWFLHFNYAVMLEQQGRMEETAQQLLLAGQVPAFFDGTHRGFANLFHARVLLGLDYHHQALEAATRAIEIFEPEELPLPHYQGLMYRGQARVKLGDTDGWTDLQLAVTAFEQQPEQEVALIALLQWMAQQYAELGQWQRAFEHEERFHHLRLAQLRSKHEASLVQKQAELLDTLEQQRQRLADRGQEGYLLRQKLLLWQSLAALLALSLIALGIWKLWPNSRQPVLRTSPTHWRRELTNLLSQCRQQEQALRIIQVKSEAQGLSPLEAMVTAALRPGDRCLAKTPGCWLIVLPGASKAEVAWRCATLADAMVAAGILDGALATVQALGQDDTDSLLSKLHYQLLHQKVDQAMVPLAE